MLLVWFINVYRCHGRNCLRGGQYFYYLHSRGSFGFQFMRGVKVYKYEILGEHFQNKYERMPSVRFYFSGVNRPVDFQTIFLPILFYIY